MRNRRKPNCGMTPCRRTFHCHFLLHHASQHLRRDLVPRVCAQIHNAGVGHLAHGRGAEGAPQSCSARASTGLRREKPWQDVVGKPPQIHDGPLALCDSVEKRQLFRVCPHPLPSGGHLVNAQDERSNGVVLDSSLTIHGCVSLTRHQWRC